MSPMRTLSISRPWAELILRGKTVENRTWNTSHRGPLLLHAAQSWVPGAVDYADTVAVMSGWPGGQGMPRRNAGHPTGIVGVADLADVCGQAVDEESWPTRCGCGLWAMSGQHHWRLVNVRRLAEPVPCLGALGLWAPPADVLDAVHAQLDAQAALATTFGAGVR